LTVSLLSQILALVLDRRHFPCLPNFGGPTFTPLRGCFLCSPHLGPPLVHLHLHHSLACLYLFQERRMSMTACPLWHCPRLSLRPAAHSLVSKVVLFFPWRVSIVAPGKTRSQQPCVICNKSPLSPLPCSLWGNICVLQGCVAAGPSFWLRPSFALVNDCWQQSLSSGAPASPRQQRSGPRPCAPVYLSF